VAGFGRPGGNITGHTVIALDSAAKRVELLRELVPDAAAMGLLVNPSNVAQREVNEVREAARVLGVAVHVVTASNEREFASAFATLTQQQADALVMSADLFLLSRTEQLAALATHHRVPAMFAYREYVAAGGLTSYGANLAVHAREVGIYVGRILKGEKPADLPVQQATKLDLIINLRAAKALGLTVPPSLLARADEVIE
jgi:putative tryptophan/tyrosine transport system substrate-binding protein